VILHPKIRIVNNFFLCYIPLVEEDRHLRERLSKIWEDPNFIPFFKQFAKRSPLLIKKGNIIFYEGDEPNKLYFIKSGFVKLYHLSQDGKDTVIYLYGPGGILGIRALTSLDQCLKHNALAITDVEIVTVSRKDYLDILCNYPEYLIDLLHVFIKRLNYTERKLEGFITTDAKTRIASFFSDCAARFGRKNNGFITLPIPFTHQLISEFVGSARETVTGAMKELEKEGILKIEKGKITVFNLKKLYNYSSIQTKTLK